MTALAMVGGAALLAVLALAMAGAGRAYAAATDSQRASALTIRVIGLPRGTAPAGHVRGPGLSRALRSRRLVIPGARPGRYVIALRPVVVSRAWKSIRKGARALPRKRRVRVRVRKASSHGVRVAYGAVFNPGVRRAPSGLVAVKGSPMSPRALIYRAGSGVPRRGQILMAAPSARLPAGLISRVIGVSGSGSRRLVSVRPVALSEAIPQWEITRPIKLDLADPSALRSTDAARAAQSPTCDWRKVFEFGVRLDEFEIRHASSKLFPPRMSFTFAARTTEWLGPKVSLAAFKCRWTFGKLGPWRRAIPVFGVPVPVYIEIPLEGKVDIGSLSAFKLNLASTSVVDLDLGFASGVRYRPEGTNVWTDGHMRFSGNSEAAANLNLQFGVGDPKAGNVHVSLGFGPSAKWVSGKGCDLAIDLGSLSAGARIGPVEAGTPSWTPFSIPLWHGCQPQPGGGDPGGGNPGGGDPGGGDPGGGDPGGGDPHDEPDLVLSSLATGWYHSCGLRDDETVRCWGWGQPATPPGGTFTYLEAGHSATCGLRTDRTVACWGIQATAPPGTFTKVSVGDRHACGLHDDGTAVCWGLNGLDPTQPPGEPLADVSAGPGHTCGLREDQTAVCWGGNTSGESDAPPGTFTSLAAGGAFTCGLRPDKTVACWGEESVVDETPAGAFTQLAAAANHMCGLRSDGSAACWGSGGENVPPGPFTQLSAHAYHTCALRPNGTPVCWGIHSSAFPPPRGPFKRLVGGPSGFCGLRADASHSAACWGWGLGTSDLFDVGDIVPGSDFLYVIRASTNAAYYLGSLGYGPGPPPDPDFAQIATSGGHTCGLRSDGHAVCWGDDSGGQASPPSTPTFKQIAAGGYFSCGLRTDGTAVCWGVTDLVTRTPMTAPDGAFTQLGAGYSHACGLRPDGTIRCWGADFAADMEPPGFFTQVSVGGSQTCGLRADGRPVCVPDRAAPDWAAAPEGRFTQIVGSGEMNCGLRPTGVAMCWGNYVSD